MIGKVLTKAAVRTVLLCFAAFGLVAGIAEELKAFFIARGRGGEVDTPLDYGDYYFLEALLRFRALTDGQR